MSTVFADHNRNRRRGSAGGEPIAPADDEAGVIAESAARKIILAAAAGNRGAEFRDRRSAEQCVESADDPNGEKEPGIRQVFCDVAGSSNDSRGDGVSDGRGHAEPHAENFEEPPGGVREIRMDQRFRGQWRLLGLRIGEQSKAAIITAEAGIARGNSPGKNFECRRDRKEEFSGDGRRNSICPIRMIRERARNKSAPTFESNRAG